ncbi:hypothetical protein [Bradyrhizobium sp. TM233]|uniref:hypothetical protein n=1 Tax=Bradyrhizobium sp. TM233 TaxID=2599801 RepID=UPI0027D6055C|nr:hypothetical protein TM233_43760 [Bradyrhizobium sp. TM233]
MANFVHCHRNKVMNSRVMNSLAIVRFLCAFIAVLVALVAWTAPAEAQQLSLRVVEASLTRTIDNHQALKLRFDEQSKADLAEFSARYIGRRVEFSVPGRSLMIARMVTSLSSGEVQVFVDRKDVADELAASLATGKANLGVQLLDE